MADNAVNLPGGFGGLTHYNEEYDSKFNLSPTSIIVFILLIIGVRITLPYLIKIPI